MSSAEVGICNQSLSLCSANRIISLEDSTSIESSLCAELYPAVRDELLEDGDFSFATHRVELAALITAPAFPGDTYYTALPGDFLHAQAVYDNPDAIRMSNYIIEGDNIITDFSPVYLVYTRAITDPTKFSKLMRKALYFELASQLCIPLTEDPKREASLAKRAEYWREKAIASDGVQGSQRRYRESQAIEVR